MTTFGRTSDRYAGFAYASDAGAARRQLNLSIGVVVILAIAIVTAALSLDTRPVSARGYAVMVPSATTQQAESTAPAFRS